MIEGGVCATILDLLVRHRAEAIVERLGGGLRHSWRAFLVARHGGVLVVLVDGDEPLAGVGDVGDRLRVSVAHEDRRLVFETCLVECAGRSAGATLRLEVPAMMAVNERRRNRRYALQPDHRVRLRFAGRGDEEELSGALLNLSPNGLAVRLAGAPDGYVNGGRETTVHFSLGEPPLLFVLPGRLVAWTPASAVGEAVVGVEFLWAPGCDNQREALHVLLGGSSRGPNGG
jgi:hypothetical protein